jgi:hypothetical protein
MMRRIVVGGLLTLAFATGCSSSRSHDRVVVVPPPRAVRHDAGRDVIVVERTHVPKGNAYGWWKKHGYREVTVYYDGSRYYGRRLELAGIRAVVVYQREGKYYMADGDGDDRGHEKDKGKEKGKGKDN